MILSAVRRCALPNSLGPLVCSTICRCARPCHCCRSVTIRFVSGDRDPNGKLTPDDDEGAATTTTTTTKASSSAVPSKTGSEAEESGNRNRKYIEINLFGPKDARAPFPGNIGISPIKYDRQRPRLAPTIEQFRLIQQHNQEQSKRLTTTIERQLFDYETIADRQNRVIEAVAFSRTMESELNLLYEPIRAHLDLRVFECPQLIAGDLKQIFQAKGLDQLSLLMITVNQLECEAPAPLNLQSKAREFIDRMCEMLNNSGFWCDYITPNESGLELNSNLMSINTIEACERYRRNAFRVEQQDSCRMIQYDSQVNTPFYGSIFTNATLDAQPLQTIVDKIVGL